MMVSYAVLGSVRRDTGVITNKAYGQNLGGGALTGTRASALNLGMCRLWDVFVNTGIQWRDMAPTTARTYNWTDFDNDVAGAVAKGFDIIFTFGSTPNWANGSAGKQVPPTVDQSFYDFVTDILARSAGRIKYWEVWNEFNDATSYWSGTVAKMVTFAQNVNTLTKAANPANQTLTPSTTAIVGLQKQLQFLKAGGAAVCDIFNAHIYPFEYPDTTPGVGQAEQVYTFMYYYAACADAGGMGGKPIWIDEGGWLDATQITVAANRTKWAAIWPLMIISVGGSVNYDARSGWYLFDYDVTPFYGELWSGTGSGLNAQGVAYQIMNQWLIGARWTSRIARVPGTNQITNPTATGLVAGDVGSGGTTPTGWTLNGLDSTHGIIATWGAGGTDNGISYITLRLHGTTTSGAVGATQLFLRSTLATATNSQWWVFQAYISLDPAANTWDNSAQKLLIYGQDNTSAHPYQRDNVDLFAAKLPLCLHTVYGVTAASGITGLQPLIQYMYPTTVGTVVDVTLRIGVGATPDVGAPTMDTGTQWSGTLLRPGGATSMIRWDMAGGPTTYTPGAGYNAFQTDGSTGTKTAISTSVSLTGQPMLLSSS